MTEDIDLTLARPPVVVIRSAKPHDLPELKEMIALLAAHHGDAAPITADDLERDLFGPMPWIRVLVADGGAEQVQQKCDAVLQPELRPKENRLIGYAILVPLYRAQEGKRGMDLHHLFVRNGHRGNGIGEALVARAREQARNAGCDYLSVAAATGNVRAHRFYEHMDFKPLPVTGMRYLQALG